LPVSQDSLISISTGLGTNSSPGKVISTSAAGAPHLLYHDRIKGLVTRLAAIAAAPNPSSIMVGLNLLFDIVLSSFNCVSISMSEMSLIYCPRSTFLNLY
jgi:hypothetical protein